MLIGTAHTETTPMSGAEFRAFQESRPDHERWELIGGMPVMMVPPTLVHNRIAENLSRLLNDALAKHDAGRLAMQRSGVELGDAAVALAGGDFRPEPDVVVMDADCEPRQRFIARAYVLAEIVSDTDNELVPGTKERWIAVKRRLYQAHPPCEAVVIIEPERIEVRIDRRTHNGWVSERLIEREALLPIPTCGLTCSVAALYTHTPLGR